MYFMFKEIETDVCVDFPGIIAIIKKWTLKARFPSFGTGLNLCISVGGNIHLTRVNPFVS